MFRIQLKVSRRGPLSSKPIQKYIYKRLMGLFRQCIRDFVLATARQIHVDTGMSVASLGPLASVKGIGLGAVIEAYAAGHGPKKGAYRPIGNANWAYTPDLIKRPELGWVYGEKAYKLDFGSEESPKFRFQFDIRIFQWFLHEEPVAAKDGQNWNAIQAGSAAFLKRWELESPRLIEGKKISRFWSTGRID